MLSLLYLPLALQHHPLPPFLTYLLMFSILKRHPSSRPTSKLRPDLSTVTERTARLDGIIEISCNKKEQRIAVRQNKAGGESECVFGSGWWVRCCVSWPLVYLAVLDELDLSFATHDESILKKDIIHQRELVVGKKRNDTEHREHTHTYTRAGGSARA